MRLRIESTGQQHIPLHDHTVVNYSIHGGLVPFLYDAAQISWLIFTAIPFIRPDFGTECAPGLGSGCWLLAGFGSTPAASY